MGQCRTSVQSTVWDGLRWCDSYLRVDTEGAVINDIVVRDCREKVRSDEDVVAACFLARVGCEARRYVLFLSPKVSVMSDVHPIMAVHNFVHLRDLFDFGIKVSSNDG